MIGAFDFSRRKLIVHTSCTKRSTDFIAFLEKLDNLYGPKPGVGVKPVVICRCTHCVGLLNVLAVIAG